MLANFSTSAEIVMGCEKGEFCVPLRIQCPNVQKEKPLGILRRFGNYFLASSLGYNLHVRTPEKRETILKNLRWLAE